MSYTTKPIELPLSTEKEYVLADVIGWEMSYLDNSQYTELMKVPFSFSRVTDKAAYIDGNFGVNISDFEEYRFLEEVIRQPQANEFNTDSIAVTEHEEEEFNAMANSSEIPNSSEWDGTGLPQVGCIVSGRFNSWNYREDWEITYISNEVGCYKTKTHNGYKEFTFSLDSVELIKKETQEQREERERLEAINKMALIIEMEHGSAGNAYKKYCSSLYDAGYRK